MEHYQMVEKLREKANVSYEQAKDALENSDWDLLDALVYLENQGVTIGEAKDYSTKREKTAEAREERRHDFTDTLGRVGRTIASLIEKANKYTVQFKRDDEFLFGLPLTAFAVLVIFMFWWVVPLMIVGLFFRFHYALQSPDADVKSVNRVMEKASEFADNIKQNAAKKEEK